MGFIRKAIFGAIASVVLYQILHYIFYDAYAAWRYAPNRENTAGKRILVTGSSKGIGRGLAELYSELGAHVTVHGRSLKVLTELAAECRNKGAASVHTVTGDMSKIGEAEKTIRAAAEAMGGLDIVIVNHISPYLFGTLHSTVSRMKSGQLQRNLQVDLLSYAESALASVPLLEKSSGSIVFVSSVAARMPVPYLYEYVFAKKSLEGLVTSFRQELALNGSSVHAGIAVLGAIDTKSAGDLLPEIFKGKLYYAPVDSTARGIASVAVGRLRELMTPWTLKQFIMMFGLSPESSELGTQQICKRL